MPFIKPCGKHGRLPVPIGRNVASSCHCYQGNEFHSHSNEKNWHDRREENYRSCIYNILYSNHLRLISLRKQPTFRNFTTGFHAKWHLRNKRRNSILMRCHYPGAHFGGFNLPPQCSCFIVKTHVLFFCSVLTVRLVVVMHPFPLDVRLRTHLPQKETHKLVMCRHFLSAPHLPRLVLPYTRSP